MRCSSHPLSGDCEMNELDAVDIMRDGPGSVTFFDIIFYYIFCIRPASHEKCSMTEFNIEL